MRAMRVNRIVAAAVGIVGLAAFTVWAQQNSVETKTSQTTGKPEYTLRARVPLTILDVVVTDAKGHPVHGLKQSDFTILENNEEMKPNSFEEFRSDEAQPAPIANLKLPANTFTNTTPTPPKAGPINVLLLDSLNTPIQVQQIVQQQMLEYLSKMRSGTRMMIFGLTTHLFVLQGLTTDPELLKAAIGSKKNIAEVSPLTDRKQDPMRADDESSQIKIVQDVDCDHMAVRGEYTLTSMKELARYLSGMPGRKNLIWFSGSFPIETGCYDSTEDIKSATDLLARAHVTINPVDGRAMDPVRKPTPLPLTYAKDVRTQEHFTMDTIAEQTGGKATYNSNDLAGAVSDAVDSGSNFYTITYTPANSKLDTRFRHISVKVDQPGLHLVYRPGYYALDPDTTLTGKKADTVSPLQSALMRGTLEPTQILFKVKIDEAAGTGDTVPTGNKPSPKMKAPYRHYTIAYAIDVNNIAFAPSPDGNYRGDFEYGVNVFNADGDEMVNSASKEVSPILPPAVYQSMLKGGANAHQEIAVPATGEYFIRIAVHDLTSDRVGAIEVPTSSITPGMVSAVVPGK
jgi:VWFA-related protein